MSATSLTTPPPSAGSEIERLPVSVSEQMSSHQPSEVPDTRGPLPGIVSVGLPTEFSLFGRHDKQYFTVRSVRPGSLPSEPWQHGPGLSMKESSTGRFTFGQHRPVGHNSTGHPTEDGDLANNPDLLDKATRELMSRQWKFNPEVLKNYKVMSVFRPRGARVALTSSNTFEPAGYHADKLTDTHCPYQFPIQGGAQIVADQQTDASDSSAKCHNANPPSFEIAEWRFLRQ